tara:strand:+ start:209 stop:574 length:366 start_codon:yes stop_codon:yes gene_type:complete
MQANNIQNSEGNINDALCDKDVKYYPSDEFYKEKIFVNNALLLLKLCLFVLAIVSLLKVSYISKIRVNRLREIKNSFFYEKVKFSKLSNRFDDLFSLNGEQRFMKDQHQMISKDILRVIWR